MRQASRAAALVLASALAGGCSATPSAAPASQGAASPPTGTPGPAPSGPAASANPRSSPDLTARPLTWFAPLPPMPTGPGRQYTGSDDFMDLFAPGAPWPEAASHLQVFKLYGEWVAHHATDAQLRTAVEGIAERGLALGVEMGPLDAPADCGQGVEGFAGLDEAALISSRIRQAGGTLQVIALDEPWFYAHVYDGPGACHWTNTRVAEGVTAFATAMRAAWPGVIIGDIEPTPVPVDPGDLTSWLDVYRTVSGGPFAFLHIDLDWARSDWTGFAIVAGEGAIEAGVPLGLIYNGGAAQSDATWLQLTGRRILDYADEAGGDPQQVVFQSWMDKPDRVLPESDPLTFTALIDRWATDRESLGASLGGDTNLALGRPASASASAADAGPGRAVDGIADTLWNAGVGPPASIEIDLGAALAIGEVRLLVGQTPAGATHHLVTCRTSLQDERFVVGEASGETADLQQLSVKPASPMTCRYVGVETVASQSWVAWREIEVYPPE